MGTSVSQIDHFFIIIFALVAIEFYVCSGGNHVGVCREEEKRALLCFKKELEAPLNWVNGVDCCSKWEGVVCDNVTGHVIELQLANLNFDSEFASSGKLSSCLLELKQLRYLDLSGFIEYFTGSSIPKFIGSLVNLQYLNLSYTGFEGIIPHQLGNLSSLHTLVLQNSIFDRGLLKADSLDWLSRLSNLEYLGLSNANLSMADDWVEVINMLPSLGELHLSGCDLPKLSHLPRHSNSSLTILDLSYNEFNSVVPRWLFNLNNLVSLDLRGCGFQSPFPDGIHNLTSLTTLDISENEMNGSLPSQLFGLGHLESLNIGSNQFQGSLPNIPWNLTSLRVLDISFNKMNGTLPSQLFDLNYLVFLNLALNQFQGPLPSDPRNLTSLKTFHASGNHLNSNIPNWIYDCTSLESVDLSYNQLNGTISKSISNMTSLSTLDISTNVLTGKIPKQIGKLYKLQKLCLSGNKFYGSLPKSLGYLFSLTDLLISNNTLEGIVTEKHFFNLTKLRVLVASGNRLTLNVSLNWKPPFQLDALGLSGWNLGPQFPYWLKSQHSISEVDLSNAGIKSEIPTWFWSFSSQIVVLNLSHNQLWGEIQNISFQSPGGMIIPSLVYLGSNQFSGALPRVSFQIRELDMSNNYFSGDISHFLCHAQNVSNRLRALHLGKNNLSGEIPDCWGYWPRLKAINMRENKLTGSIPNSIGLLNELRSLDLHKNMLFGHIPASLQNCTLLLKVDLSQNGFKEKIPRWLGARFSNLTILKLRSNKFYGEIPPEFCHLTSLQILDLANNNFFGVIPKCLKNLTAMISEKKEIQFDEYSMMEYSISQGAFRESALVTTKGHEYEFGTNILLLFAGLDLSSNKFIGKIPTELTNLKGLRSLNLSRNNLTGNIPVEMGSMKLLESLDLSRNQFSGKIPSSFSSLYSLGVLDLSYNNLSGKIPSGTQLQGFNASCYIGNNLCGAPLSQICSVDDGKIPKNENKGDESFEIDWFYVSMAIGFAVGFWGTCGSLFLVRPWRISYFKFLDKKLISFFAWVHCPRA